MRLLSAALLDERGPLGDALRLALSRIIITKEQGASLARDVSHSRPHRTRLSTPFSVRDGFLRAVERIASRLEAQPPQAGAAEVALEDARHLASLADHSVDVVLTSPPYLNAIDYLRGHRLALVWLGYRLRELRAIRARMIGGERRPDPGADLAALQAINAGQEVLQQLPRRERGIASCPTPGLKRKEKPMTTQPPPQVFWSLFPIFDLDLPDRPFWEARLFDLPAVRGDVQWAVTGSFAEAICRLVQYHVGYRGDAFREELPKELELNIDSFYYQEDMEGIIALLVGWYLSEKKRPYASHEHPIITMFPAFLTSLLLYMESEHPGKFERWKIRRQWRQWFDLTGVPLPQDADGLTGSLEDLEDSQPF